MFRVNYLPPEQMPAHQRDFPHRPQLEELPIAPGAADSRGLGLLVAWYLVSMIGGIILLGYLTASPAPNTSTAAIGATLSR
jgi:hypothetical protein